MLSCVFLKSFFVGFSFAKPEIKSSYLELKSRACFFINVMKGGYGQIRLRNAGCSCIRYLTNVLILMAFRQLLVVGPGAVSGSGSGYRPGRHLATRCTVVHSTVKPNILFVSIFPDEFIIGHIFPAQSVLPHFPL